MFLIIVITCIGGVGLLLLYRLTEHLYEVTKELYNIGCQLFDIKEAINDLDTSILIEER